MKAATEARGFKASKSDWSTGNIKWVEVGNELQPRYAISQRNDLVIAVQCTCGKVHNAHTAYASKCACGKKHDAVELQPTAKSAGLVFAQRQPEWNAITLDNFNIKVHKDVLALALACAAYERNLNVHGLEEQINA
jgi:hypothetical protein